VLTAIISKYSYERHHPLMRAAAGGIDVAFWGTAAACALCLHGDIALARSWLEKLCAIYESMDLREMSAIAGGSIPGLLSLTNCVFHDPYFDGLCLRLMKSAHLTFTEVEAASTIRSKMAWESDEYSCLGNAFLVGQMKRRHWLLAPDEVGKDAMEEWLTRAPAEWGSAGKAGVVEVVPAINGEILGACGCAEVFESLGRFEEAITAAQADIRAYSIQPVVLVQSHTAIGRCHARLGQAQEAAAAFEAAIAEAQGCTLHYLEMLARRDYIVHVLDAEGRRDSQLAALGGAISRMVLPPGEYASVLGPSGIDAEAAVSAFVSGRDA
jgi:hypothetical protein